MKITSYEQAEEALRAIADYCNENEGYNLFASLSDGVEKSTSACVGKYLDIVPSLTMTFIADKGIKEMVLDAITASTDPKIVKSYWESNPQNIQN